MTTQLSSNATLDALALARQLANHAERLGVEINPGNARAAFSHLGALLADCVLQAGLNYQTVVKARVQRIVIHFPEAAKLSGVRSIIDAGMASDFLSWNHDVKIQRFVQLVCLFEGEGVEVTSDLKSWLVCAGSRDRLLNLHGIGPKTYDYMCCLAGIDCIAIDRHIRTFAYEAGVPVNSYDSLKAVVSYAADLLGLSRRDFDAWIWSVVSQRARRQYQLELM
jgi:hypothetical protein